MKPPFGGGFFFFVLFNSTMELILFPLLVENLLEYSTKFKLLIGGSSIIYYVSRTWTYLYFAPTIMFEFMPLAMKEDFTKESFLQQILLGKEVEYWIQMSWLRTAMDAVASFLLFTAIYYAIEEKSNEKENIVKRRRKDLCLLTTAMIGALSANVLDTTNNNNNILGIEDQEISKLSMILIGACFGLLWGSGLSSLSHWLLEDRK
jgi:hypothetical protein